MTYNCYDSDSGRIVSVFANVASARLTGVATTIGSAEVTVASTVDLWPGMWVVAKGVPANTLVLSVDSDTTFTMTADATAALVGGIMVARGYVSEAVVKELHIEHYRDIFGATGEINVLVTDGSGTKAAAKGAAVGSTYYVTNPTGVAVPAGFGDLTGFIAGDVAATQSDEVSHTAPREQIQKVSTVFFVCTDGAILPASVFPHFHFAQEGNA